MKFSGIYQIQSKIKPERIYIGSAVNINRRWLSHLDELRKNTHGNSRLQNHYNKYGKLDLIFSVLIGCDKGELLQHEQFYIDAYKPFFNICKKANSRIGVKASLETRLKISKSKTNPSDETRKRIGDSKRGIKQSAETKLKKSIALSGERHPMFGKHHSEESKQKMRKKHKPPKVEFIRWNKGKKGLYHHTEEIKERLRKANTGENNPQYGKRHTEEHKRKISEAGMGRKKSDETRKKLSEAMKGKPSWRKGKKLTEEHKQKISNTKKGVKRCPYKIEQIPLN